MQSKNESTLAKCASKKNNCELLITEDPFKAVLNSDCIMTDKWISMNDKINKNKKKKILKPYQVNKKIMTAANKEAIFMHCLQPIEVKK